MDEGHDLKCIEIAEKVAKLVGIDEIRVDIFIRKGYPQDAMVNEDSISSGECIGPSLKLINTNILCTLEKLMSIRWSISEPF